MPRALPWLCIWTEARTDRKLETLTDAEHRVWFKLLLYSAESEPRGTVDISDRELLAIEVSNGDVVLLEQSIARMERMRMISIDGHYLNFVNFASRQYRYASDRPDATRERKRKSREKKADSLVTSRDTRDSHDTSRPQDITKQDIKDLGEIAPVDNFEGTSEEIRAALRAELDALPSTT